MKPAAPDIMNTQTFGSQFIYRSVGRAMLHRLRRDDWPALHSELAPQLSWPESALFLILLAASILGFWLRFRKVWRVVGQSKKDPDFHVAPVGRRVADFVWEVMLQGKVISQRPLPGLAHALVFLGILRLRADHAQPFRGRCALGVSGSQRLFRSVLFRPGRGLCDRRCRLHRRIGVSPLCDPAEMAGAAFV